MHCFDERLALARIIHEGSSRNGGVARDKRIRDTSRGIRDIQNLASRIPNFESRQSRFSRQSRPSRLSQASPSRILQ